MDKETLEQYRFLRIEIQRLEKRLERLESNKIARDIVKGSNPEFPYQEMTFKVEGISYKPDEINSLKSRLKSRYAKAKDLKKQIEDFIAGIFDSRVRLIFEMRYIEGRTWVYISKELGSSSESYARMIHDRYLRSL